MAYMYKYVLIHTHTYAHVKILYIHNHTRECINWKVNSHFKQTLNNFHGGKMS